MDRRLVLAALAADQLARAVAAPLQEALGRPVLIENEAGSGGNLGGDAVANSPADGCTLLMSSGGMVSVDPHIDARVPFDPAKDPLPVASIARVLVFLVVRNKNPVAGWPAFLAGLKARPGRRSFGSPGIGSSHIKAGRLRLIAVGSPKRSPLFPDAPTLAERGLKGFDADTVSGRYAPAGKPAAAVSRLNAEVKRILRTPPLQERLLALGGVPAPLTPAESGAEAAEDSRRFGAMIRERKIGGD